ncbi:hypothetical protein B1748_19070 [Paenibacillus sp. MY03]|jgi:two-component system response regulator YesN|uniref:helix-turn-helix domain-containing protein n=1 Tax=Paenibacillus sp. MY03 TaxID=302980 RepID=UPI000B3C2944|nr:helix-turn-helix domain-containing protein [Paenibacillus sp. MY03]OUS75007.1 hypothetical protein B1748_19070 [Paenibacillus sp. MY03]
MSRKTNFFLTMFLAFLLMLMFPTALTTVLYHNMNAVIKEDVQNSSNAMLRQISLMIDSRLHEVEQLAIQISFHPKIIHMFSRNETSGALSVFQYKEIMDTLSFHFITNGFIQDRYVYFNKQDTVVTPYVRSDASDFYQFYYKYEELSEEDWLTFLRSSSDQAEFLPAMNVAGKSTGGNGRLITYRHSIPIGTQRPSEGAVVILIDAEQIRMMLSNLESANKARIFVADKEGRLLVRSGEDEHINEADLDLDKLVEGKFMEYPDSVGGERLMATKYVSKETGWQYISLVPHSVMMAKVNRAEIWALTLLGICILFGLLGAYLLAKRLYSPIHNLVSSILKRDSDDRNKIKPEFSLIEETLSQSWRSEEALKVVVDQQVPLIQSNFLNRLLNGIVDTGTLNEESLRFMGFRFESEWFSVVIINVDDFRQIKLANAEQQWAMIRFIISNISQELLGRRGVAHAVETELSRLVLLVNLHVEEEQEGLKYMETVIDELKNVIESRFNIVLSIGISGIRQHYREIASCYAEALEALEYRIVKGKSSVTYYQEIDQMRDQARYYYPMEIEMQLANAIRSGDFEQADRLMKHIEQMNFQSKHISLEMGKLLYFDMMSTMIKIWNDTSERVQHFLVDDFDPLRRLTDCSTLVEMQEQIRVIYQEICDSVIAGQRDPGAVLVDQISAFIDEHYSDNSLSLNMIAERFNLSPQYLSSFFKKHKGINLADYMARIRVEQAKRLLQDPSLSLNRIAELVGYAKDAGLIRIFKKYMGVTPGKYREYMKD